jgi:hypothetical protein
MRIYVEGYNFWFYLCAFDLGFFLKMSLFYLDFFSQFFVEKSNLSLIILKTKRNLR